MLVVSIVSCEEESKFPESNIALTPVYSITNISNESTIKQINVYKEQPLTVEFLTDVNLLSFESTGYNDASTDTDYVISWTVEKEIITEDSDGNEVVEKFSVERLVNASKIDGIGTMDVVINYADNSTVTTLHDVTVLEDEVYN
ncbi:MULTISPECIES: hypothetical protein [unclassified Tamlana]|uniref:hypothetical protein n=1 Tax=unclassified Tamlana TaxID=2614803 RepID=UPI0026E17593|nr:MULTISPECIES: hypothetical protein [unclassified Tamlana]MDO6791716.1 hypothetical protein [Tamlana sp. 1_MG-2023]